MPWPGIGNAARLYRFTSLTDQALSPEMRQPWNANLACTIGVRTFKPACTCAHAVACCAAGGSHTP
eukprot:1150346-Pelagomonas_calceolata.AAC.6